MKEFALLLNKLYFTYSHHDKMTLLQQYFATTPDPEKGYALAAMANTLKFPTFKRSLVKELVEEHFEPFLFGLSWDYVGDLSETIALLWPSKPLSELELPPLSEIIITFNHLSEQKIKYYLVDLLNKCNAAERWALLKLGTGSLRIGVSARFLKKTLATYGKVELQEIESIWHATSPPYIELFAWLEKKSERPIIKEGIYFHPVMLSHPIGEGEINKMDPKQFLFEKKFDGIRVQVVANTQEKALFTRTGDDISHSFPDILATIKGPIILDGELVIYTEKGVGSFNDLQQRLNRKQITKKLLQELPAAIIAYDILKIDDEDLKSLPLIERRKRLEQWVTTQNASNILLSDLLTIKTSQSLYDLKKEILEAQQPGVEGLMIKHHHSPYIAGRPKGYWYKWKRDPLLIDAVLMYAQRGQGKRSSYYSDYTFGLWQEDQLLPIGKAYFGFTDEELKKLDKWIRHHTLNYFGPVREVEKALVFEVAFDAVRVSTRHKSGVALRFPRIHRIRWDKPAHEADQLINLIKLIPKT